MAKLTKKQENQITAKALVTAAKQVESSGVQELPAGSYPFDINTQITGELLVKKGSEAGPEVTVIDFSPNDVLRGLLATADDPEKLVSDALGWHKSSDKNARKTQDEQNKQTLLKCAKRRKMTKEFSSPAKAGAASAKPTVRVTGKVGQRQVAMEVKAA
tara:strand:+ start:31305 stop:31781 length:477 start_codon:yes stop_codon:yes gene_type:complete